GEAAAIAGLTAYEIEADSAALRALGVSSVAALRRLVRQRDAWLEAKLPLLTKVALERALAKHYAPRSLALRLLVASLTGGAVALAAWRFWPQLGARFPLLAALSQRMQLQRLLASVSLPRLPRIRLVVEKP